MIDWLRSKLSRPAAPPPARSPSSGTLPGFLGASPGWWAGDTTEQLRNYRSWVYSAVNAIAQEVARQRPLLMSTTGQADHEQQPLPHTHPLVRLMEQPNPWLTPWELWYLTMLHLELTGNCYWYLAPRLLGGRPTNLPAEIWIIPTPWVRILPDAKEFIGGYEVSAPGAAAEYFRPDEILHLKYPNPLDLHYGLSPLAANAMTIDANTELQRARYQTFTSGQRPGMVIQTEQTLSEPVIRRLEEKVSSRFGGRDNWQRPLILEQGLRASPWTLTPAEMDYLNSAKLSRDEILAIFRVPSLIAGLIENVGLGGDIWFGARMMFCEGTIQPRLELLAQCLTRDLARRWSPDLFVTFPDCSPSNQRERRADDELDARTGLRTFNEIRRARGLKAYADPRFDHPPEKPA